MTETFVPKIEYGITLEILPTKHNIKVTDNAIVAPAKKCVTLSKPTFLISFVIILFIFLISINKSLFNTLNYPTK